MWSVCWFLPINYLVVFFMHNSGNISSTCFDQTNFKSIFIKKGLQYCAQVQICIKEKIIEDS